VRNSNQVTIRFESSLLDHKLVEFLLLEFDDQKRNLTNSFRKKITDVLFFASDLFSMLREHREVIIFLIDETRFREWRALRCPCTPVQGQ
jgi:hypothetical protein